MALYYNDRGQRVHKQVYLPETNKTDDTYYVRDASGNPIAVYNVPPGDESINLEEHPIYGSDHLGVFYRDLEDTNNGVYAYQLIDHLGNVRAVLMKNGDNAISLTAQTDYYPGGMAMPNRNVDGGYRYGYQGEFAETDDETGKVAFEARLYDPRINRWLTPDPAGEFFSPYLAMGNNWINTVDPDGRCTKCPKNAKVGDTYNHPDYGTLTFTKGGGWGNDTYGSIMDDVVLSESSFMDTAIALVTVPIVVGLSLLDGIDGNSGSTMYGRGGNDMSRRGDGEIYGVWHYDEMMTPGNPSSPARNLNKYIEAFDNGMKAGDHILNLGGEAIIENAVNKQRAELDPNEIRIETILVKYYVIDVHNRKIDSFTDVRRYRGNEKDVRLKIDSTKKSHKSQYRTARDWDWEN